MDVAREMEVEVLHRDDLRVAAAGRAALDPEHRAERGLTQAERDFLANVTEPLGQRDRRGRFPLAGLRRRDRGNADQLAVGDLLQSLEDVERDLGLVLAKEVVFVVLEARVLRDLRDRPELRLLGDLEARRHLRGH
jgi:hypothetical protein